MWLRKTRAISIAVIAALLAAGCALVRSGGTTILPEKRCGPTSQHTVTRLFEGIIDAMLTFSFAPIRFVIAEGANVFGIFGDGDKDKGWRIMLQLYRHPEVLDNMSDAAINGLRVQELVDLGNGESRVLLERRDAVTSYLDIQREVVREETTRVFRRNFAVRFQPGTNCITAIRPLDPHWTRVR